jgi:transcriptional regulator with XRE-family HTH domain
MQINPAALKAIRENCGYTQLGLAKESGVDQGNISKMEKGDTAVSVRPATAKKLATALNVPIAALTIPEPIESEAVAS